VEDVVTIAARLSEIRRQIAEAATSAGRSPSDVTLVAVSKKHPAASIREAYAAGQRDFGENYAQELVEKREQLADLDDLRWHFIGALQSNKARFVVPGTVLIHAVDRISVAEALSKRAVAAGTVARLLIEVNVGREASKAGVPAANVSTLIDSFSALPGVQSVGLMCIPPPGASDEHFEALRALRDHLSPRFPALALLSMGMTSDFPSAIRHGATHVRVGTAIFGART
jgi:hypothetical protein